jgi:hypothetical protein
MTGNATAAEEEAINTAYSAAWPVPKIRASAAPSTAATTPTSTARSSAVGRPARSDPSRTGTCVPTTNITSAKPMLASRVKVGSAVSTTSKPVLPMTIPANSSPTITGMRSPGTAASSGPAKATRTINAKVWKPNAVISVGYDCHDTSRHGIGVFSSVR